MGATPGRQARLTPARERGADTARAYAESLLASLDATPARPLQCAREHPAITWASSGLMALTGETSGAAQMCPAPLATCADGALAALASLAPPSAFQGLRGSLLLGERAAIAGYFRTGSISPGGSCRLLKAADGTFAINLARDADWALVPAWLEAEGDPDWNWVERTVQGRIVDELVTRARLLGLAACPDRAPIPSPKPWYSVQGAPKRPSSRVRRTAPQVIDLSSLWAGPLCSHLLQLLGAEVIKFESLQRPDGARQGPAAFFDLLNAGKRSVALDLAVARGREQLCSLLAQADIVIEASRPRALRQLGIQAEEIIEANPCLTWISITGYGRGEPEENWVAYGDDAGVAAGLSQLLYQSTGQHLICGDAITDPLTGLHAALAAWCSYLDGGGRLIAFSLTDVVRHCIQFDLPNSADALRDRDRSWSRVLKDAGVEPAPPLARASRGTARPLGADTQAVLAELGIAC